MFETFSTSTHNMTHTKVSVEVHISSHFPELGTALLTQIVWDLIMRKGKGTMETSLLQYVWKQASQAVMCDSCRCSNISVCPCVFHMIACSKKCMKSFPQGWPAKTEGLPGQNHIFAWPSMNKLLVQLSHCITCHITQLAIHSTHNHNVLWHCIDHWLKYRLVSLTTT